MTQFLICQDPYPVRGHRYFEKKLIDLTKQTDELVFAAPAKGAVKKAHQQSSQCIVHWLKEIKETAAPIEEAAVL